MAILWIDGFEGYATFDNQQGYDLGSTATVFDNGRGGGRCSSGALVKRILSKTEIIVGFAYKLSTSGEVFTLAGPPACRGSWLQFLTDNLDNVVAYLSPETGGTLLYSQSPGMRINGVWRYYEHRMKIGSGTTGSYELRIDETPVVTLSGIDTYTAAAGGTGASATVEKIRLSGSAGAVFDDFYLADTTNGPNFPTNPDNDFLGDLRMFAIHPNGPVLSGWTPKSLPENWQEVKDVTTDNLATYVQTGTVTAKDIYDYEDPNLPPGTDIIAIATMTSAARLGDAGPRQLTAYVRGGVDTATATTEVSGGIHQLSDTYYMEQFLRAQNPATGARWTASEVDKIRAGFALTA